MRFLHWQRFMLPSCGFSDVVRYQHFGEPCCSHLQGCEMSLSYHVTTQSHNLKDHDLNLHFCGNLKSCTRTSCSCSGVSHACIPWQKELHTRHILNLYHTRKPLWEMHQFWKKWCKLHCTNLQYPTHHRNFVFIKGTSNVLEFNILLLFTHTVVTVHIKLEKDNLQWLSHMSIQNLKTALITEITLKLVYYFKLYHTKLQNLNDI
jgi:hypothetical protein